MQQFVFKSLLALASCSTLALPIFSAQSTFALVPSNTVVISNSGSTNAIGYRIYLSPSGQAAYVDGKRQGRGKISPIVIKQFFGDLRAAEPLSQLPIKLPCLKPASFGTSTSIRLGAQQSGDLSCPGNDKAKSLFKDVNLIKRTLHVTNVPRSEGKELPPQNF